MNTRETNTTLRIVRMLFLVIINIALCIHAGTIQGNDSVPGIPSAFEYPYRAGKLSFPQDEGKHPESKWPFTMMEWTANYTHLTADDGRRYFIFSTFITYDPVAPALNGKFPHAIYVFMDIENGKRCYHRDMNKLNRFTEGHVDIETTDSNYFRWKGSDKPFSYDYHITGHNSNDEYAASLELEMVKPPLVLNGTGYIPLPKGVSGYYSQTRLKGTGYLSVNGIKKHVQGIQWVDRQWLGLSFIGNLHYSYEWWALQLDNNEEAIMFRIWNTVTDELSMTWLEINHADGKIEHIDKFTITDLPSGWHLSAPQVAWNLTIAPACNGQITWQSCNVSGTVNGVAVTGVATAELARDIFRKNSRALSDLLLPYAKSKFGTNYLFSIIDFIRRNFVKTIKEFYFHPITLIFRKISA